MTFKLVVAVTDNEWFDQLRGIPDLTEVNFWAPSGTTFRALNPGELFLFKLHAPKNFIVGGGVFAYANTLPCSLAWEAFGVANGAKTLAEMRSRIGRYRRTDPRNVADFQIGCRILTQPFFLDEYEWLSVPPSFAPNVVKFKTYSLEDPDGRRLWEAIQTRVGYSPSPGFAENEAPRHGEPIAIRPRLGQGAFRVLVTDIYHRRCAVTNERTLPALDAAHIRPYSEGGLHIPSNGLLLRRDIHSLFDSGYVTVTPDFHFEVSHRIREEFENGRDYYALHGKDVSVPSESDFRPDQRVLTWHNNERFLG